MGSLRKDKVREIIDSKYRKGRVRAWAQGYDGNKDSPVSQNNPEMKYGADGFQRGNSTYGEVKIYRSNVTKNMRV